MLADMMLPALLDPVDEPATDLSNTLSPVVVAIDLAIMEFHGRGSVPATEIVDLLLDLRATATSNDVVAAP